jgi:hypothetical protein
LVEDGFVFDGVRQGDDERCVVRHGPGDCEAGVVVAGPAAAGDAVVDVPREQQADARRRLGAAVQHEAEAAVDDLAPADAAAVVQRHPGGAAERVAHAVLHRHVGAHARAVRHVGSLSVRTVRPAHVVVVPADYDLALKIHINFVIIKVVK